MVNRWLDDQARLSLISFVIGEATAIFDDTLQLIEQMSVEKFAEKLVLETAQMSYR